MRISCREDSRRPSSLVGVVVASVFLAAVRAVSATTYMSVEPIPNRDIVGQDNLTLMRAIGYANLERWSELLLSRCLVVENVIETLSSHGAIATVTNAN